MPRANTSKPLPTLDIHTITQHLQSRFEGGFKTISDIPSPATLHDGIKAAKRIAQAVQSKETITVVGDYDVDGVTATAIMSEFFAHINYPITTIIPNRFTDGYGVSQTIIDRIDDGLIITVDNGISATHAATICKQRGLDLIITDHHTPPDVLPDCFAIVNPKLSHCAYPFKEICGAQVAWLLLALVKKELAISIDMRSFLDLLSIAIVADVMPLIDINRAMVQKGLQFMGTSSRPCITALRNHLNKSELSSEDIAFQIAPRINAAGRMEDASIALRLLTAPTVEVAHHVLAELDNLNTFRKDIEAQGTKQAVSVANSADPIIVVALEDLHEGVVGIIASRLVAKFQKPAIVFNIDNGIAKGSARSIGQVNIHTLLTQSKEHILKFGGHKMAAGLSVELDKLTGFIDTINSHARKLDARLFIEEDGVLGVLPPQAITFELINTLKQYEPYGEANPRPRFALSLPKITNLRRFGAQHIKFDIPNPNNDKLQAIGFSRQEKLEESQGISFSFTLNENRFRDEVTIQLMLDKIY